MIAILDCRGTLLLDVMIRQEVPPDLKNFEKVVHMNQLPFAPRKKKSKNRTSNFNRVSADALVDEPHDEPTP